MNFRYLERRRDAALITAPPALNQIVGKSWHFFGGWVPSDRNGLVAETEIFHPRSLSRGGSDRCGASSRRLQAGAVSPQIECVVALRADADLSAILGDLYLGAVSVEEACA